MSEKKVQGMSKAEMKQKRDEGFIMWQSDNNIDAHFDSFLPQDEVSKIVASSNLRGFEVVFNKSSFTLKMDKGESKNFKSFEKFMKFVDNLPRRDI